MLYADTSALVRAYLADEPDHAPLREMLLDGDNAVFTSELTRAEFASAVIAAGRARRTRRAGVIVDRFEHDAGPDRSIRLLRFDGPRVLPLAVTLLGRYRLSALDAVHLAVASTLSGPDDALTFVTRDERQRAAARSLRFKLA